MEKMEEKRSNGKNGGKAIQITITEIIENHLVQFLGIESCFILRLENTILHIWPFITIYPSMLGQTINILLGLTKIFVLGRNFLPIVFS